MKRIAFLIGFIVCVCTTVIAQTADWLVAPQYSDIRYFGPRMYKVILDGKVGIIGADGNVIVPVSYDAINLFYEGRTIFVNRTSNGWQVMGVLSEAGTVNYADGTYYLLPDYMFYSEGLLTVRDGNGRYGYLDDKCQPAFAFTSDEVHPFSEGFAAVGSGDTFHWINTSGEPILPRLKNGGTPYGGTNFYNGKAYLWDEDGVFFVLTDDGRTQKIPSRDLVVDYLYRVDTGLGEKVEYSEYDAFYVKQWIPEERNGRWTYMSESGKLLTPFQYDQVNPFSAGVAIAMVDGKYGLLHVVDDKSTFYTRVENQRHIFSAGKNCVCEFQLVIPQKWRGQDISVILKDQDNGTRIVANKKSNDRYSFSYKPRAAASRENKTFNIEVRSNDIQLWQGEEMYSFVQRAKLSASIRVNNADADANDRCFVTATIKNPSSVAVTTSISFTGGGAKSQFDNKSITVTIPANGSKSVTSIFHVKKVELAGWCSVSTSEGASARRSGLELRPF